MIAKSILHIKRNMLLAISSLSLLSCNDFLDRAPLSNITPEVYLVEESQLASYAINLYPSFFTTHSKSGYGTFANDDGTDNMAGTSYNSRFVKDKWKVSESGGNWYFTNIRKTNYFLDKVIPRLEAGTLSGSKAGINHYIGEVYFLRAMEYFTRVKSLGDFPIIDHVIPQDENELLEVSKRAPHNEVVRFILSDLDKAISLLSNNSPDGNKSRISKWCAYLLKSRVALYEASWLRYHANTAFVPGGPGWTGESTYPNYQYPAGSIEAEAKYFFEQARDAAKQVVDNISLTNNTYKLQQASTEAENPYFSMFSDVKMSRATYPEVLLWKEYNLALSITNTVSGMANKGGNAIGLTRGYVDNFLMDDGKPIYCYEAGDYYKGDDVVNNVVVNRDNRLFLFLKKPGDKNVLTHSAGTGNHEVAVEPYPAILDAGVNGYSTGYACRKGLNFDGSQDQDGQCTEGCIVFRASEAYLNYMEASYEIDHNLSTIKPVWEKIRKRAGFKEGSIDATIANTDITKDALNDWGAYSAGKLLSDNVLYNIRRERRCEFIAEGMRYSDLKRWRSMDQLKSNPYHIEGMKLWGTPMEKWYGNKLIGDETTKANVSSKTRSQYIRPMEKNNKSEVYDGYTWMDAYYWAPIAQRHFDLTGGDSSPIYQNPYWTKKASESALQ